MKQVLKKFPLFILLALGSQQQKIALAADDLDSIANKSSQLVYKGENFEAYASSGFSDDDRRVIGEATKMLHELLFERSDRADILNCAQNFSTVAKPDWDTFYNNAAYVFANPDHPIKLYVARIYDEKPKTKPFAAARAVQGREADAKKASCDNGIFPECGDKLRVAVNEDYIGDDSSENFSNSSNIAFWAGALAHEIGHNLGLSHISGQSGSYVQTLGDCVADAGGFKGGWWGVADTSFEL